VAASLPFLFVLLAGVGLAVQAPTNAMLARSAGSVLVAAIVSFVVGLVLLVAAWAAFDRTSPAGLRAAPGWAWAGGVYGVAYVVALAYGTPRLGLAAALTLAIAGQIAAALVLDHFGLLGLKTAPIGPARLAGAALVVAGVVLVRRG